MIGRRGFLLGLTSLIAAPAIVKADNLMKVRGIILPKTPHNHIELLNDLGEVVSSMDVPYGWYLNVPFCFPQFDRYVGTITHVRTYRNGIVQELHLTHNIVGLNGVTAQVWIEDN
jgi:hypothetical protein